MSISVCIISLNPQEEMQLSPFYRGALKVLGDFFKVTKGSQGSIPGSWPHSSQCTSPAIRRGDPTLTLTFDVDLHAFGHGQPF